MKLVEKEKDELEGPMREALQCLHMENELTHKQVQQDQNQLDMSMYGSGSKKNAASVPRVKKTADPTGS